MMLRVADVAARFRCSRKTVYAMIRDGELEARRLRGMIRIPLAAVEAIETCHARTEAPTSGEQPTASGTCARSLPAGALSEARANVIALGLRQFSRGPSQS